MMPKIVVILTQANPIRSKAATNKCIAVSVLPVSHLNLIPKASLTFGSLFTRRTRFLAKFCRAMPTRLSVPLSPEPTIFPGLSLSGPAYRVIG